MDYFYTIKDGEFYTGKSLLIRLTISSIIVLGIIELPCMSLMLHLLYGKAFLVILYGRIVTKLVLFPIQIIVIYFLSNTCKSLAEKYLFNKDFD